MIVKLCVNCELLVDAALGDGKYWICPGCGRRWLEVGDNKFPSNRRHRNLLWLSNAANKYPLHEIARRAHTTMASVRRQLDKYNLTAREDF